MKAPALPESRSCWASFHTSALGTFSWSLTVPYFYSLHIPGPSPASAACWCQGDSSHISLFSAHITGTGACILHCGLTHTPTSPFTSERDILFHITLYRIAMFHLQKEFLLIRNVSLLPSSYLICKSTSFYLLLFTG